MTEFEEALDFISTVENFNQLWLFHSANEIDQQWKDRLRIENIMCNYQKALSQWCVQTKCEVTATAIRAALCENYDTDGGVGKWLCNNDGSDGDTDEAEIYQIQFNGGNHWMTYLPHSGAFYHSWYNRFSICKGYINPGPISRQKCTELYEASLLHVDHSDRRQLVEEMEIVILWPPVVESALSLCKIVKENLIGWKSSYDKTI